MNFAQPLSADTLVERRGQGRLAVVDVADGADVDVRFAAIEFLFSHVCDPRSYVSARRTPGADVQDRTGDLVLTKDALCQLSYIGLHRRSLEPIDSASNRRPRRLPRTALCQLSYIARARRRLERETGIEPATNSLEGCDSTTELLPPSRLTRSRRVAPATRSAAVALAELARAGSPVRRSLARRERRMVAREGLEPSKPLGRQIYSLLRLTASLPRQLACLCVWNPCVSMLTCGPARLGRWSWRRDLNPRPADYKSAALPD